MNKKNSNDTNISNLKKREILRILIIIFSVVTIILAFANLFYDVNLIFGIIAFVITAILNTVREKTQIKRKSNGKKKNRRTL